MNNYIIELAVIHSVLVLGYWLFLSKEQQYAKMRFYLLGATLFSLIIPLLKLPKLLFFNSPEPVYTINITAIPIDAAVVTPMANTPTFNYEMLILIYLAISVFFLIKLSKNILYLIALERKSSYEKHNNYYIRKNANVKGSFTFFNWIFLSNDINNTEQDYEVILKHEKAHVQLGHTYDILFFETLKVVFWWLPSIWFVLKEIRKIHEYQADAHALKSYHIDKYSKILISATLKSNGLGLASSFHDGLILKRLKAMKQNARNVSPWKLITLSVLSATLFIVFACSEELDQELKELGSQSSVIYFDQLPSDMQSDLVEIKDQLTFTKISITDEGKSIEDIADLKNLDSDMIHSMNVDKPNGAIYVALRKEGANFDYLSNKSKVNGDVFTVVEEMPEYEGGMEAFYNFVSQEIEYPIAARENGVEGRVIVQFVVGRDGAVSNVEAIKGIGYGCDEEAVRVIQKVADFKPGSQRGRTVRVRMDMPIIFKINEGKVNLDESKQGIVIVEEAVLKNSQLKVKANYADGIWTGTIYDEQGKEMPGANILVAGTNDGTVSDLDGTFKIASDDAKDLQISFVGYESLRLSAN